MLFTVDIGNTNIAAGVYDGDRLCTVVRIATDPVRTSDSFAAEIQTILTLKGIDCRKIDGAIIGSVVPAVGASVAGAVRFLFGVEPVLLGPGVRTGLNIRIDNPAQLGADLAAGAVAAAALYPLPCIVFDLGTATTVSVLDAEGCFLGGAIAAGLRTTLDALASQTAQLPAINIEPPEKLIGTNTVDCMKSGLVIGAAAMMDGMIGRIEAELGGCASVVATGGLSHVVVPLCTREIVLNEHLLLEGLRLIYNRNVK